MKLTLEQKKKVLSGFEELNQGVEYVVPRGFVDLPGEINGGDVDIIVNHNDFDRGIAALNDAQYEEIYSQEFFNNIQNLVKMSQDNRAKVINLIQSDPRRAFRYFIETLLPNKDTKSPHSEYSDKKLNRGEIMFHLQNHLAYSSPHSGRLIRVDPRVEEQMFNNRKKNDQNIYVASEVDELVHLLCRGIFDYGGNFPEYYQDRCKTLHSQITTDLKRMKRYEHLLDMIFYRASKVVKYNVESGQYSTIREDLFSFDDY